MLMKHNMVKVRPQTVYVAVRYVVHARKQPGQTMKCMNMCGCR